MKGIFEKSTVSTSHLLSKSDKKKYNKMIGDVLDVKQEYTIKGLSNKIKIVSDSSKENIFFIYYNRLYPCIKHFNKDLFKIIYLDDGARAPLKRGADVMVPGVKKYKDMIKEFEDDEIVGIVITDKMDEIFGVGRTLMNYTAMLKAESGPVIEIYHVLGDILDSSQI